MNIYILYFFLILIIESLTLKLVKTQSTVLLIHIGFITAGAVFILMKHPKILLLYAENLKIIPAFVCIVFGVMVYVIDLAIKNILTNDVLIVDLKYYFTIKKQEYLSVMLSLVIAFGEEIVFHFPICIVSGISLLLLGSITYGISHRFFSVYDMFSKIVFGVILGLLGFYTKNALYAVIVHIVYNIAVGIFGGLNIRRNESSEIIIKSKIMEETMNIIVRNVNKIYQKPVLQDISLRFEQPGVYLIAGPNGSGKTTLLEIIAGLRKPDSGTVAVNGNPCGSMRAKQNLGFLCQQNGLRKTIKLKEEMHFIKEVFDVDVDDMEYLEKFNLQEYYKNRTRTLSGGTQRRFLTAMLFLAEQDIVILDEPASGLDTYSRDEIWNTISEYGKEHIVIVSDHYLNQARQYSDKIILLDQGKIIANDNFEGIKGVCKSEKLIKVRKEHFKSVQAVIDEIGAEYEVKVSGTVYNIYLKNKVLQILAALAEQKITAHDLDLEDIYFYMTGKKSYSEEVQ